MAFNKIPETAPPDEPVLYTPPGAAPRGLRSDPFTGGREEPRRAAPDKPRTVEPPPPAVAEAANRDWDFAMPASAPVRQADPHLDPDVNWRRHVGLRPPVEAASLPETTRERFSENWERLASEPLRPHHGKMRRNLEKSPVTRWLFNNGRFDFGNALGPLLLLGLLAAAIFYGTRVLAGSSNGKQSPPAAESPAGGK